MTTLEITDILTLPRVSITERRCLPPNPGIYFVVYNEQLVYVGSSVNMKQRWGCHNLLELFWDRQQDVEIYYLELEVSQIRLWEAELIDSFLPLLNETTGSGKRRGLTQKEKDWIKEELGLVTKPNSLAIKKFTLNEWIADLVSGTGKFSYTPRSPKFNLQTEKDCYTRQELDDICALYPNENANIIVSVLDAVPEQEFYSKEVVQELVWGLESLP